MRALRPFAAALALLACSSGFAAQTVVLPAWVCTRLDGVFAGGFEAGESALPHAPSLGSGGASPGAVSRQVTVPGLGTQPYYLYLPLDYTPRHPWPLLLALHGAGGPGTADSAARTVRGDWGSIASGLGVIVAAPVGTDTQAGGWIAPLTAGDAPTDYDIIAKVVADAEAAYNIETTRLYGWGYSSGGHVMHSLALNGYNASVNAGTLAAYSVSAGVLEGEACRSLSSAQCASQVLLPAARKVPVDIHIGNTDPLLSYAQSDQSGFAASGWSAGGDLFFTQFSGGHVYSLTDLQQGWSNICGFAVVP